jgi:hypothetical protein
LEQAAEAIGCNTTDNTTEKRVTKIFALHQPLRETSEASA